jgi:ATP-dependent Zn protease
MSDSIGQLSFKPPQSEYGLEDKPYSQSTADKIDLEVRNIVREVSRLSFITITIDILYFLFLKHW